MFPLRLQIARINDFKSNLVFIWVQWERLTTAQLGMPETVCCSYNFMIEELVSFEGNSRGGRRDCMHMNLSIM